MSKGLLLFGMSSIRFQAVEMYILPLLFTSSFTIHVSDLTRSAKNLERTVPRQIELSCEVRTTKQSLLL